MWQSEQKLYYRSPSEALTGMKGKVHSKAGSNGCTWILSQISASQGSNFLSLCHLKKKLVEGLTPEDQISYFQIATTLNPNILLMWQILRL